MRAIKLTLEARPHRAIGLMSGTSHDGVSAAVVELDETKSPPAKLIAFRNYRYNPRLRTRLLEASSGRAVGTAEISALNFELGCAFGRAAVSIARLAGTAPSFIGSHGHTFFHLPPRRAARNQTASTLQLGESAVIAAMTGAPVVADFRPMDVVLGGEGAPLAPLSHLWLLAHTSLGRVVQNLGGIANLTYLPAGTSISDPARVVAFDTGPGVGLIDAFAAKLSRGRMRMDRGGAMAAAGKVSERLLAELMRKLYFRRRPPKSTGREEFGVDYLSRIESLGRRYSVGASDLIATVTALTARSIADACRRLVTPLGPIDQLIATGGGARNATLMRMLRAELAQIEVLTPEQVGVDGDALEAVAFAILAYRMLRGEPGNIPSVTGASASAILGKLTLPPT